MSSVPSLRPSTSLVRRPPAAPAAAPEAPATLDRIARLPRPLLLAGLVVVAAGLGLVASHDPRFGVAAGAGIVFAAFLLIDLPVAIGIWIVALYLAGVQGTHGAVSGTSAFLIAGWAGTLVDRLPHVRTALPRVRWALLATGLMLLWSVASLIWAPDGAEAVTKIKEWSIAAAALPVIATAVRSPRDVLVIAGAFVGGATIAVLVGIATGSSDAPVDRLASFEAAAGRLSVGITDPNYLAADIVAALAIVAGLVGVPALGRWRLALLAAVPVLLYGLVATQSRGGFIAAAVMVVAAGVLLREHRARILGAVLVVVLLVGVFLAASPRSVDRLTQSDSTGTGRIDIWHVAVEVFRDNPVVGVGIGNFVVVEPEYADRVGYLQSPGLIVDTPLVTHDVWLQAATEGGIVGLLLQAAIFGTCIGAALLAARGFRHAGRSDLAHASSAIAVGQLGTLAAATFIANGNDRVFWVLLALGPAMLAVAPRPPRRRRARG